MGHQNRKKGSCWNDLELISSSEHSISKIFLQPSLRFEIVWGI
jgi:hypothetical protein